MKERVVVTIEKSSILFLLIQTNLYSDDEKDVQNLAKILSKMEKFDLTEAHLERLLTQVAARSIDFDTCMEYFLKSLSRFERKEFT